MRLNLKRTGAALIAAASLAGCATSSEDISAAYVSPMTYDAYTCPQLTAELVRISTRVNQVAGAQDTHASNDKIAMGVGVVLFWPALFFLKGNGPEAQELAQLKGQYDAVNQTIIRKNCGSAAPTTAATAPQATPAIAIVPATGAQPAARAQP